MSAKTRVLSHILKKFCPDILKGDCKNIVIDFIVSIIGWNVLKIYISLNK